MTTPSLTQLVAAIEAGDDAAWPELVRRLAPAISAALGKYDVDPEARADATGEAWRILFERLSTVREPERLHGWISVVACNQLMSILRRASRKRETAMVDEVVAELHPVEDVDRVVDDEAREALRHAVSKLSEREQALIHRRFLTDEPEPLVAIERRDAIPVGSIGPTLGRGLTKLRRDPQVIKYFSLPTT